MKNRHWKTIYTITFFIGFSSAIWGIKRYELTFVNSTLLLVIGYISTLITFFLIRKHYSEVYQVGGNFNPFFQSLCSSGLLTISLLLIINYELASSVGRIETHRIEQVGSNGGRGKQPYAVVIRNGRSKKLIFSRKTNLKESYHLELAVHEGFFGWDIVKKKKIINNLIEVDNGNTDSTD